MGAHEHGIKVILDVTTHGVVPTSPVIKAHPGFFKGRGKYINGTIWPGSWRMIDYNYSDIGFRNYWPKVFSNLVDRLDVDGFRLDCGMEGCGSTTASLARPLWDEVARSANASGKPVLIMPEEGATYHMKHQDLGGWGGLHRERDMTESFLKVRAWPDYLNNTRCHATVQLSCHDNGKTTNISGNYFNVKASRAFLGYNLLSPFIVVMMSGEEFNVDQVELPATSWGHYGMNTTCHAEDPPGVCTKKCYGPGYWLYDAQIQWSGLRKDQLEMRSDTQALMQVRKLHPDVLHTNLCHTNIVRVNSTVIHGQDEGYVPYMRFEPGIKALLVVANPSSNMTLAVELSVAPHLRALGFLHAHCFRIEDLFQGGSMVVPVTNLSGLRLSVRADKQHRGGLAVLLLVPIFNDNCNPSGNDPAILV